MRSHMHCGGLAFILAAVALGATVLCAQPEPEGVSSSDEYTVSDTIEVRTHFSLFDGKGKKVGEATKIIQHIGSSSDRVHVVYRSSTGDELVIEDGIDYTTQRPETKIRTRNGDAWIAFRSKLPFTGKTRGEMLDEARRDVSLFEYVSDVEIATNSGTWHIEDSDWERANRIPLTTQIRRGLAFELLELIERESEGVLASELTTVARMQIVDFVLYQSSCPRASATVKAAVPDCTFDRSFGFPCSPKQLLRAEKARKLSEAAEQY